MDNEIDKEVARRTAACLAFKHIDEVTDRQCEEVLVALIDSLPAADAARADRMLFHLREQRKAQLELAIVVDAHLTPGVAN